MKRGKQMKDKPKGTWMIREITMKRVIVLLAVAAFIAGCSDSNGRLEAALDENASAVLGCQVDSAMPAGVVGAAYPAVSIQAQGGSGGYLFALAEGSGLPEGLTLSADGKIEGVPIAAANADISVTVTDSEGAAAVCGPYAIGVTGDEVVPGEPTVGIMPLKIYIPKFEPKLTDDANATSVVVATVTGDEKDAGTTCTTSVQFCKDRARKDCVAAKVLENGLGGERSKNAHDKYTLDADLSESTKAHKYFKLVLQGDSCNDDNWTLNQIALAVKYENNADAHCYSYGPYELNPGESILGVLDDVSGDCRIVVDRPAKDTESPQNDPIEQNVAAVEPSFVTSFVVAMETGSQEGADTACTPVVQFCKDSKGKRCSYMIALSGPGDHQRGVTDTYPINDVQGITKEHKFFRLGLDLCDGDQDDRWILEKMSVKVNFADGSNAIFFSYIPIELDHEDEMIWSLGSGNNSTFVSTTGDYVAPAVNESSADEPPEEQPTVNPNWLGKKPCGSNLFGNPVCEE